MQQCLKNIPHSRIKYYPSTNCMTHYNLSIPKKKKKKKKTKIAEPVTQSLWFEFRMKLEVLKHSKPPIVLENKTKERMLDYLMITS